MTTEAMKSPSASARLKERIRGIRGEGVRNGLYIYICVCIYVYPPGNLGKRKIVFKMPFLGDILVPWMDGENNGKPY